MAQTARIVKQFDKDGVELHPATTVDAIVDMQPDGSAIRLDTILNAIISQGEATKAMTSGKCLHPDACFTTGMNSVLRYNNRAATSTDYVVVQRISMPDSPTGSGFGLRITSRGVTSPGRGGVYQTWYTRANAIFIQRIVARIPIGFTINSTGNTPAVDRKWLTPQIGTGDWFEYVVVLSYQSSGTFSSDGYLYITGGDINVPLQWDIALLTSYDATGTGFLVDNNLLNTTKTALETKITAVNTEVLGLKNECNILNDRVNTLSKRKHRPTGIAHRKAIPYNAMPEEVYTAGLMSFKLKQGINIFEIMAIKWAIRVGFMCRWESGVLPARIEANQLIIDNTANVTDKCYIDLNCRYLMFNKRGMLIKANPADAIERPICGGIEVPKVSVSIKKGGTSWYITSVTDKYGCEYDYEIYCKSRPFDSYTYTYRNVKKWQRGNMKGRKVGIGATISRRMRINKLKSIYAFMMRIRKTNHRRNRFSEWVTVRCVTILERSATAGAVSHIKCTRE